MSARERYGAGLLGQMRSLSERNADLESEIESLVEFFVEQRWDKI
jgi:hypothetical protein